MFDVKPCSQGKLELAFIDKTTFASQVVGWFRIYAAPFYVDWSKTVDTRDEQIPGKGRVCGFSIESRFAVILRS